MILKTLRALTDELNHGTRGVNALLAGISTANGDATPAALALIADETRHVSAAIGRLPDDATLYPCLMVSQPQGGNTLDPMTKAGPLRDGTVQVVVRYGALDPDAPGAASDLFYTLEAVTKCVSNWLNGTDTAKTVGNVAVLYGTTMTLWALWQPVNDKCVAGALALSLYVRDTAP
jgi:hypothetical protein